MKRLFGISTRGLLACAAPVVLLFAQPSSVSAQTLANIHGKVTNPAGQPLNHGDVKLTTDKTAKPEDRKFPYSFPIDSSGNFVGTKVSPGDYLAVVVADGKNADFQNLTLKNGDDKIVDFDMSRAEYLKAMTPEDRANLEKYKKENAAVTADNAKISDLNAVLKQARLDEKDGKADEAVKNLTAATQIKPDEPLIWASLGEAQLAQATAAYNAARAAKTSPSDPAILQLYGNSAVSYQKAIDLNATAKKPNPETVSASYMNMGEALAKSGKVQEAAVAYDNAVKAVPASAGQAFYNEAAVFYNAGKLDEANAAADKGIAADPNDPKRALIYYIKGASLIPKATMDPKTNKFVAPPGCIEAYQEYLELEPTGSHATEVKELLTGLGQPVKNSFKASRKK